MTDAPPADTSPAPVSVDLSPEPGRDDGSVSRVWACVDRGAEPGPSAAYARGRRPAARSSPLYDDVFNLVLGLLLIIATTAFTLLDKSLARRARELDLPFTGPDTGDREQG